MKVAYIYPTTVLWERKKDGMLGLTVLEREPSKAFTPGLLTLSSEHFPLLMFLYLKRFTN